MSLICKFIAQIIKREALMLFAKALSLGVITLLSQKLCLAFRLFPSINQKPKLSKQNSNFSFCILCLGGAVSCRDHAVRASRPLLDYKPGLEFSSFSCGGGGGKYSIRKDALRNKVHLSSDRNSHVHFGQTTLEKF
ncbi:hypothetical protein M0802_014166 [Mischocyttarus mexicanus]|nr:hypothetical protein M0802_014166 [Mischocyttarus mexicanus]